MHPHHRWPPVIAGIVIGLCALAAFVIAGRGVGMSGALTRLIATFQHWMLPEVTEQSAYFGKYFAQATHPLHNYLVYLLAGVVGGAFVAAMWRKDFRIEVRRGPHISPTGRLINALIGGVLVGFAARLARGCTSGQGIVGAVELSVGSWVFLLCIFMGGFGAAWFVRRQWI